jgi:hypothetical protein
MESLSSSSFVKSRATVHAGGFAAGSLGDLKDAHRSAKRLASRVCKTHRWREAKYSRTCTRCGFVEDK